MASGSWSRDPVRLGLSRHPAGDASLVRQIYRKAAEQRGSASCVRLRCDHAGSGSSCSSAISRLAIVTLGFGLFFWGYRNLVVHGPPHPSCYGNVEIVDHDPVDRCRAEARPKASPTRSTSARSDFPCEGTLYDGVDRVPHSVRVKVQDRGLNPSTANGLDRPCAQRTCSSGSTHRRVVAASAGASAGAGG